ncbi:MAG: GldG family protein [Ignavibacteriales bacterium]|nr:GldG family protein [Ignavibacteriales bacterium]
MNTKNQTLMRVALIVGILIFINIISIRIFSRFDLTESKAYTLSDASKNLVKNLDDKFIAKAYFTDGLPSPYNNHRRYLKDQLDEYRAYSHGNFQYEIIDPSGKEDVVKEAQKYGIPEVQVQVVKEDKMQIEKALMGVVFLYGDKKEAIPVIQKLDQLEYDISLNIKKLTQTEQKKVGILSGHDEPTTDKIKELNQLLSQQYEVQSVSLASGTSIPEDISALLVIGPKTKLQDWELYLLDQYIMKGGKVAFFVNKVTANLQQQFGQALDVNLDKLLESYGVRVNTDMVRDGRCANITVQQQAGFMVFNTQVPFPYLPVASEFNPENILVKNLQPVLFYFVSSIDTSLAAKKNLSLDVLLSSSNQSGRMQNVFPINPNMQFTQDMFKEPHLPLAVTIEGNLTSAFDANNPELDSTTQGKIDFSQKVTSSSKSRIVVVGDGDFVVNETGGSATNALFAGNLVDWLIDDVGLTTIRGRVTADKPLDEVEAGTKTLVKSLNLAVPPLFVILFGIARWRMKVLRRKRLEMAA